MWGVGRDVIGRGEGRGDGIHASRLDDCVLLGYMCESISGRNGSKVGMYRLRLAEIG
jgi:hypothetical protein